VSAIKDPVTREVIASSLGAQWNDRVVQIFATLNELRSGVYTGWAPIRGTLAYAEDVRALFEVVDFDGNGAPIFQPVAARGAIVHYPASHPPASGVVTLPSSGAMTTIVKVAGSIRYGRTYGFAYQCTVYTPSGNLGLWSGEAFVQRAATPGYAIGTLHPNGWIRLCGQGWANGVFSSIVQSGLTVIGPMASNEEAAEFVWRGSAYPGLPDLYVVNPVLSIIELGGHPS